MSNFRKYKYIIKIFINYIFFNFIFNDSNGLAKQLKDLSTREKERMEKFGYNE